LLSTVVASGGKATVEGTSSDVFEMLADKNNYPVSTRVMKK
jgi:hypothetical protein